jgi:lipid II:glycine glycyltransferase (peptidoglycan interpeptide bridge formation enzyme)
MSKQERYIHEITISIANRLQDDFHYVVITNHPEFKDIRGFKRKEWRQNIVYSYCIYLRKIDLSLISPSKRGWIKKARKRLITVEEVKDVKSVYNIINDTYIRQNLKCPLTLEEISGIYKRISDNMVILAAKEQEKGKYIAVYITIIDSRRNCVYSMFNGYDTEFANTGANSLLLWEAIEYFRDKGFEFFDIGEALMSSKTSFKSEFSSDIIPFYQVSKSNLLFKFLWHFAKGKFV